MKRVYVNYAKFLIAAMLLGSAFLFIAIRLIEKIDDPNTDFFSYWLGARMMWTGESPYDETQWVAGHHAYSATWISDLAYLYPLPLAALMAPLGLLPLKTAFISWILLTEVFIALSAWLALRFWRTRLIRPYLFPIFAGVVLFRPVLITLVGGQLGGVMLLMVCLALVLWRQDRWFWGGLCLSLLILKPNTGFFILLLAALWLLRLRKWQALAGMLTGGLALLGIGLLRDPGWVQTYLFVGNRKVAETFGYSATVWGMASGVCSFRLNCTLILGSAAVVPLILFTLYLLLRRNAVQSPVLAMSLVLCCVLAVTPYIWPYDQVLLILPLIAFTGYLVQKGVRFLYAAPVFLVYDLIAIGLLIITVHIEKEIWNGVLPLVLFGGFAFIHLQPEAA